MVTWAARARETKGRSFAKRIVSVLEGMRSNTKAIGLLYVQDVRDERVLLTAAT